MKTNIINKISFDKIGIRILNDIVNEETLITRSPFDYKFFTYTVNVVVSKHKETKASIIKKWTGGA